MSIIYQIDFTDPGVTSFTINPASVNGPGFPNANTSLTLHGTGRLDWGEKVNENFVKILETSASPQRAMPVNLAIVSNTAGLSGQVVVNGDVSGTFNPDGFKFDIVGGSLIDDSYTVQTSTYNGINDETTIIINESFASVDNSGTIQYTIVEPDPIFIRKPYILGQMWFNKTDTKTYVYKITQTSPVEVRQWALSADGSVAFAPETDPPLLPLAGTLWYNETTRQLNVWNSNIGIGGEWESVGDVHTGSTQPNSVASEGQLWYDTTTRQLKVYNGGISEWEAVGDVHFGIAEPNTPPSDGQLWYDTTINQLKIHDATTGGFTSVAERYVLKSGDTMTGDGIGGLAEVNGVLNFNNTTKDFIQIGQSQGTFPAAPDIKIADDGWIASGGDLHIGAGGSPGVLSEEINFYALADNFDITNTAPGFNTVRVMAIERFNVQILPDEGDDGQGYSASVLGGGGEFIPNTKYVRRVTNPVGTVIMHAMDTIPFNFGTNLLWLECDGSAYGSTDPQFLELFDVIGYVYGGAGAIFNVPNYNNQFLVGGTSSIGTPTLPQERSHIHFNGNATISGTAAAGVDLSVGNPAGQTGNSVIPVGITIGADYRPAAIPVRYFIKYRSG